jgi:hypothetical protein
MIIRLLCIDIIAAVGVYNRLGGIGLPELLQPAALFDTLTTRWFHPRERRYHIFVYLSAPDGGFLRSSAYAAVTNQTMAEPHAQMPTRHRASDMKYLAACVCQCRAQKDIFIGSLPRGMWSVQRANTVDMSPLESAQQMKTYERSLCDEEFAAQLRAVRLGP